MTEKIGGGFILDLKEYEKENSVQTKKRWRGFQILKQFRRKNK